MLEAGCRRALAAPASRRSVAASTADGSDARKPASIARCARVPVQYSTGYCTGIRISDYPKYPMTFLRYLDLPGPPTPAICIYQMAK